MLRLGYQSDWFLSFTSMKNDMIRVISGFAKQGESVMEEKEKIFIENPKLLNAPDEETYEKPQHFISQLYKSRDKLTKDDILDEVNSILIAVKHATMLRSSVSVILHLSGFRDHQQLTGALFPAFVVLSRSSG
jgi:hypothetical protein